MCLWDSVETKLCSYFVKIGTIGIGKLDKVRQEKIVLTKKKNFEFWWDLN